MGYIKNGNVLMLGAGKDGLTYPASGSSPALVLDASGNGNNGVNSGAVLVADHLGNSDGALSFNGTASLPIRGSDTLKGLTTDFTVAVGFQSNDTVIKGIISSMTSGYIGWSLMQRNGGLMWLKDTSGNYTAIGMINNGFNYIVVSVQGTTITYNFNGVVSTGTISAISAHTNYVDIGKLFVNESSNFLKGSIDYVSIHSRALSVSEMSQLYADWQAGNSPSIRDGLVLDLPMNRLNCRTNTGIDLSGNDNVITNNGATLTADHNGRANRGWSFDGVNDKIVLPNTLIRNKSLLTIEFGFQRNAGTIGYVLSAGDTSVNRFSVFVTDAGLNVVIGDGTVANNYVYSQITGGYFDSNYHHFAFVFDGSKTGNAERIKMWIDGISRTVLTTSGTIPTIISNADNELSIGSRGTTYFAGKLDLLAINGLELVGTQVLKNKKYWNTH